MTAYHLERLGEELTEALTELAKGHPVLLEHTGTPVAALVSVKDLQLLERYWEELEDRTDREAVRKAREEIARDGTVPYEELRRELEL